MPLDSRKPSDLLADARAYIAKPSRLPDCQPIVANRAPYEPAETRASVASCCERSIDCRFTEPPNEGEPTVEVPTPRWIWIDCSECARSAKSAKYVPMS